MQRLSNSPLSAACRTQGVGCDTTLSLGKQSGRDPGRGTCQCADTPSQINSRQVLAYAGDLCVESASVPSCIRLRLSAYLKYVVSKQSLELWCLEIWGVWRDLAQALLDADLALPCTTTPTRVIDCLKNTCLRFKVENSRSILLETRRQTGQPRTSPIPMYGT